jgi:hypothetical protein
MSERGSAVAAEGLLSQVGEVSIADLPPASSEPSTSAFNLVPLHVGTSIRAGIRINIAERVSCRHNNYGYQMQSASVLTSVSIGIEADIQPEKIKVVNAVVSLPEASG